MRERIRTGLLVIAVLCLVAFLMYAQTQHTEGGVTTERHTLGLPFSPWVESVTVRRPNGFEARRQVNFLSASWLVIGAGYGGLWLRDRLKRPGVSHDDDNAGPPGAAVRQPG